MDEKVRSLEEILRTERRPVSSEDGKLEEECARVAKSSCEKECRSLVFLRFFYTSIREFRDRDALDETCTQA
eukprot:scaffold221_cov351-Pavlova_lutheri.AAC.12